MTIRMSDLQPWRFRKHGAVPSNGDQAGNGLASVAAAMASRWHRSALGQGRGMCQFIVILAVPPKDGIFSGPQTLTDQNLGSRFKREQMGARAR